MLVGVEELHIGVEEELVEFVHLLVSRVLDLFHYNGGSQQLSHVHSEWDGKAEAPEIEEERHLSFARDPLEESKGVEPGIEGLRVADGVGGHDRHTVAQRPPRKRLAILEEKSLARCN